MMLSTQSGLPVKLLLGSGVSASKLFEELNDTVDTALAYGIIGFDTAPSYKSEVPLAKSLLLNSSKHGLTREQVWLQDKIDAIQMIEPGEKIRKMVLSKMKAMSVDYLDACLIHWPIPEHFEKTWNVMMKLKEEGYLRFIGTCNFRIRQFQKYQNSGYRFDIAQIERHPLRTCVKETEFCRNHGIVLQAYSPLCKMDARLLNSNKLKAIAEKHKKDIGQIIMRWHLDTGYVPIFASRKKTRIEQYANIFNFSLESSEIDMINSLDIDYKMYLESFACPGF